MGATVFGHERSSLIIQRPFYEQQLTLT